MAELDNIRASNGQGDAVRATVSAFRLVGSTSLSVDATINWEGRFIATSGAIVADGGLNASTKQVFFGHLVGTNIEIDSFAPGYTDKGNSVGDVVIIKPCTAWANEVADFLAMSHNNDGTLKKNSVDTDAIQDKAVKSQNIESATFTAGEQIIGYWTDGRPIYRKFVNFGALPNASLKSVAHNLPWASIDFFTNIHVAAKSSTEALIFTAGTVANTGFNFYTNGTTSNINVLTDRSSFTKTFIFYEYVKF